MARPAWALARAWPKTFFLVWEKRKKLKKKNRKKGKMGKVDNLKTAFMLSLFLA
jgi:hypothetical protein